MALFPRLRVSAYVICVDDERVLLSRWIGYDGPQWSLAGGGLDPGENPQQGALRELFEETGYVGELDALLGIDVQHFESDRHVPEGYDGVDVHAVRIVYRGHVTGGELTHEVGGTSDLAEWVPLDKLSSLDAVPLVAIGMAMNDGDGVPVARVGPNPPIADGVRVELRVAAFGHRADGATAGGLLAHGDDPVEVVRAAFLEQRGEEVTVGPPRDASGTVEPREDGGDDGGSVRWVVRLDYDVIGAG
ncbi:NUDIX domain-containing protein [Jiangella ureilytica]|uniref:NUDIX domain-containing protein n=1 Tax=Jiangella ureilytica TaxID=2530374 RepID=A0A4R4RJN2_9ACTN|nr:NUDIX domain-containing protein [Jiangella ureilytica]TDC49526.1 NUDIX domain-containing protein [Jiangella ureilytica]